MARSHSYTARPGSARSTRPGRTMSLGLLIGFGILTLVAYLGMIPASMLGVWIFPKTQLGWLQLSALMDGVSLVLVAVTRL